ncbi:hypothetical protein [Dokdonella sp.]|uniref:hypothetical protein n=1 Tax=Dokdonella sp. TaxID=2291710 RepID=UPI0031C8ED59|nr:hypothetical protein [Dokdonella sp.]
MSRFRLFLAGMLACALAPFAQGATYAVGLGTGCTHSSLQAALDEALANPAGPHLIKLQAGTRSIANYAIANPAADLTIDGGYPGCAASAPDSVTTLSTTQPQRLLRISNGNDNERRKVVLSNLVLANGAPSGTGLPNAGGALSISGNVRVELRGSMKITGNTAGDGGAISLFNLTSDPAKHATLAIHDGAEFNDNAATGIVNQTGNGGAIHATGMSDVHIHRARFLFNNARRAGGAIALDAGSRLLTLSGGLPPGSSEPTMEFVGNRAGRDTFSSNEGFGGAIYARQAPFGLTAAAGDVRHSAHLFTNEANFGGAIYVEGALSGTSYQFNLSNVLAINNIAHGRGGMIYSKGLVGINVDSRAWGPCALFGSEISCSALIGNTAANHGTPGTAGGGVLYMEQPSGSATATAFIRRTWFSNNADPDGTAALIAAEPPAQVTVERSVLQGNSAGAESALVGTAGATRIGYSTVLANQVTRLFAIDGATLRVQGSLFAAPGTPVWSAVGSGAAIVHNGCLLTHDATGLPPGATVGAPYLDLDLRPVPPSPALDVCDDFEYAAPADMYNRMTVDIPGWDNGFGVHDLGAIEQTGIVFYGGFGSRPTD